jgi:hypothetical protein
VPIRLVATKLAGVVLGICRPSHCGPTAPLLSEHISGQCRLRLSGVSAEQAPPDRLPADFAFPVQELRPGSRLPIAGTAYHDGRFATLTNVVDQTTHAWGWALLNGEKSDLVQYLLNLTLGPKDSQKKWVTRRRNLTSAGTLKDNP